MNIAIAGDSWGYCWTGKGPALGTLPGIEDILKDRGHSVINTAEPGSSNQQSISRLQQLKDPVDLVIFIQTEPVRDFYTGVCDPKNSSRALVDAARILELAEQQGGLDLAFEHHLLTVTYSQLAQWAKDQAHRVLVVGGCSQVPQQLPEPLIVAVSSWSQLLFGKEFKDCLYQDSSQWLSHEYANLVIKSKNKPLILDWYRVTAQTLKKIKYWTKDQQYFNPDDWHPNYSAHAKLVECLEKFFSVDNR